jgi:hypothetical protein
VYVQNGSASLVGNTITGNWDTVSGPISAGGAGVAVAALEGDFWFVNNVVAKNTSGTCSGVFVDGHPARPLTARLEHNTFGGGGSGPAIRAWAETSILLTNNIFAENAVALEAREGTSVTIESTLWHENDVETRGVGAVTRSGDHVGDPAFVNAAARDYHLSETSAAIDKGVTTTILTDIDGDVRPQGAAPDLGADEYTAAPPQGYGIYLPCILKRSQ